MSARTLVETITFTGHENILSLHPTTLEVTKNSHISRRADCIIGVCADKGCRDLNDRLKSYIILGGKMKFVLRVGVDSFEFFGRGSPLLTLTDPIELVLRKSEFVSPRTGAIQCTAASKQVPRDMVSRLQDPNQKGQLEIHTAP